MLEGGGERERGREEVEGERGENNIWNELHTLETYRVEYIGLEDNKSSDTLITKSENQISF